MHWHRGAVRPVRQARPLPRRLPAIREGVTAEAHAVGGGVAVIFAGDGSGICTESSDFSALMIHPHSRTSQGLCDGPVA